MSRTRWNGLPRTSRNSTRTSLRVASVWLTNSVSSCATSSVRWAKYAAIEINPITSNATNGDQDQRGQLAHRPAHGRRNVLDDLVDLLDDLVELLADLLDEAVRLRVRARLVL